MLFRQKISIRYVNNEKNQRFKQKKDFMNIKNRCSWNPLNNEITAVISFSSFESCVYNEKSPVEV